MASARRRTRLWIAAALVVTIGCGGTAALVWAGNAAPKPAASEQGPAPQTVVAERTDLVERSRGNGQLGYDDPRTVGSTGPGTITRMGDIGAVVERGGELFRIDDLPVNLLIGDLPMWRSFTPGMSDGADVLMLEENLRDLGFFTDTPDRKFTERTQKAISAWQKKLGRERTGSIEPGQVVFATGALRIAGQNAKIGDPASPAVLAVTGTTKSVSVDLEPQLASAAPKDGEVQVQLPDGKTFTGKVTSVGAARETDAGPTGKALRIPITITPVDQAETGTYADVKVSVSFQRVVATDALLVPTAALLATPGGGHSVEVLRGGKRVRVAVTPGSFADGRVSIDEGDVKEGDKVVIS
ncbi:multidrug efflux pump subunit AcrA (membrane-fusion protein) [Mycetocola sp. BIGb0189]|uniref:peptidoglycan-binding protein n=1 Tax=Mycetocola sp. BIGb0189 TaxID=2940604 RepID=UPI0021683A78|nr:peptidoglycan-binding protein [Mycetocola sp. BIGb0189]MCS4275296.1 multidrug efflux pump subunit AcrA (membrane-fusion protein) [Mycetocola sp. BIGb0189]